MQFIRNIIGILLNKYVAWIDISKYATEALDSEESGYEYGILLLTDQPMYTNHDVRASLVSEWGYHPKISELLIYKKSLAIKPFYLTWLWNSVQYYLALSYLIFNPYIILS